MTLQAIVIGTGWAGEGHTCALQAAGVEVVALCGRTFAPTQALAEKFGVKQVSYDWHQALDEFQPNIVSIATPASTHHAMAVAAAEAGCHVICEKPLAVHVGEARAMHALVKHTGVKHAYGATGWYAPAFLHTRRLLADGLIGQVRAIAYQMEGLSLPPTLPYSWWHQLKEGGGALNGIFTHQLQQVLGMTRGTVTAAMGTTSHSLDHAPVGPAVHDFRQLFSAILTSEQAAAAAWRPIDADLGFAVLLQLTMPEGHTATALFTMPEGTHEPHPNAIAFHGTNGTLYLAAAPGGYWPNGTIQHFDPARGGWVDVVIPHEVMAGLPQVERDDQRQWNQFFREFVADVRGEGAAAYPTFRDGWIASEVIDIVRHGRSWTSVPRQALDSAGQP